MKKRLMIVALLISGSITSQSLTLEYLDNGDKKIVKNSRESKSIYVMDSMGRQIKDEYYFADKKILRLGYEYEYNNKNWIIKEICYGYKTKIPFHKVEKRYNDKGLIIFFNETRSLDNENWGPHCKRETEYDDNGMMTRSKQIYKADSKYKNEMNNDYSYYTDSYTKNTKRRNNKNGQIKTYNYKMKPFKPEFNISLLGIDESVNNGTRTISSSFMNNKNEIVFDQNNNLIEDRYYVVTENRYNLWFSFINTFDSKGNVLEQISVNHFGKNTEYFKKKIDYIEGIAKQVSYFLSKDNVNWKLLWNKPYTKEIGISQPQNIKKYDISQDYIKIDKIKRDNKGTKFLKKISQHEKDVDLVGAKVHSDDKKKLMQLKRIINHQIDSPVSDEEILSMALEALLNEHKEELKKLNEEYKDSQDDLFGD